MGVFLCFPIFAIHNNKRKLKITWLVLIVFTVVLISSLIASLLSESPLLRLLAKFFRCFSYIRRYFSPSWSGPFHPHYRQCKQADLLLRLNDAIIAAVNVVVKDCWNKGLEISFPAVLQRNHISVETILDEFQLVVL